MEQSTLYLVRVSRESEILHLHRDCHDWHVRNTECGVNYGPRKEAKEAMDFFVPKDDFVAFVSGGMVCSHCIREYQSRMMFRALTNRSSQPVMQAPSFF